MEDIEYANEVLPEFIGFVFAPKSRRYVSFEQAKKLRGELDYRIAAVGVFVDEDIENIVRLVKDEVIDMVQLHGSEDNAYIAKLREMAEVPIIQAFKIIDSYDAESAVLSDADFVLLDSGMGTGKTFDWSLIKSINRPYFLAGGNKSTYFSVLSNCPITNNGRLAFNTHSKGVPSNVSIFALQ